MRIANSARPLQRRIGPGADVIGRFERCELVSGFLMDFPPIIAELAKLSRLYLCGGAPTTHGEMTTM